MSHIIVLNGIKGNNKMTQEKIKNLEKNETARRLMNFLPNELGINLSSVKDIIINRQEDGQIKKY